MCCLFYLIPNLCLYFIYSGIWRNKLKCLKSCCYSMYVCQANGFLLKYLQWRFCPTGIIAGGDFDRLGFCRWGFMPAVQKSGDFVRWDNVRTPFQEQLLLNENVDRDESRTWPVSQLGHFCLRFGVDILRRFEKKSGKRKLIRQMDRQTDGPKDSLETYSHHGATLAKK